MRWLLVSWRYYLDDVWYTSSHDLTQSVFFFEKWLWAGIHSHCSKRRIFPYTRKWSMWRVITICHIDQMMLKTNWNTSHAYSIFFKARGGRYFESYWSGRALSACWQDFLSSVGDVRAARCCGHRHPSWWRALPFPPFHPSKPRCTLPCTNFSERVWGLSWMPLVILNFNSKYFMYRKIMWMKDFLSNHYWFNDIHWLWQSIDQFI